MKKFLLILTCIAVLLSLAGCAEATVTDYDETHYSDTDGYVSDGEMIPYKTDEPLNPLLDADLDGATVYIMRNNVNDEAIEMDEETKSEFLELLMSLEMDDTPTVDENQYAIGEYVACYTIVFSDETEYLIYFMSVSPPVGNGLYGSARYIVVGDNKYSIPDDSDTYSLIQEIESYYDTQYLIDTTINEFCEIMDSCSNVAPGTAGSSLRSVSAAASLLDWAESHKYVLSEYAITTLLEEWQATCEDFDWELECLVESWESVVGSINEIVSDPTDESLLGLLDDSGYELQYDEYDEDLAEMLISAIENFLAQ
ncbi:MAG: YgdI/YgdR family lipoprotein [Oscillospiraceae bacterium]|nr:YgdI/YgdR family lipoprotein [Oscillospiraceae bacterium]